VGAGIGFDGQVGGFDDRKAVMAEPWELVLHHTYSGTPGVIFDQSPSRRSNGQPVDLSDADFLTDGAAPGSGAVRFHSATNMIRVPASQSWAPMGGVRIEMVCSTDMVRNGGTLVTSDSFDFRGNGDGYFSGEFGSASGGGSGFGEGGVDPRPIPNGDWMTLGLLYQPSGVQVSFNGTVVSHTDDWNGALASTSGVLIGNDSSGQKGLTGRIDDLRIWRLNPQAIGDNFTGRPMNPGVASCWAEWARKLDALTRSDPRCTQIVFTLIERAFASVMTDFAGTPQTVRQAVADAGVRYQQLWSEGRLAEIPAVLADTIALLRNAGFHPQNNADIQALQGNDCTASILRQLSITCDPDFTDVINGVAETF
jgi:Concanavalin A-like lectin/glucanases superfamily